MALKLLAKETISPHTLRMANATHISIDEYGNTSYRPERDYIDGEVRERNWGERPHAAMQAILLSAIHANRRTWNVVVLPEQRVQTSPDHFRIPDVCVLRRSDPIDAIVQTAPLICIEVLSPRDTMSGMQERVDDYLGMGVQHIWLIDPVSRHAYVATAEGFRQPPSGEFSVAGTEIRIVLADVFAEFDEMQTQG